MEHAQREPVIQRTVSKLAHTFCYDNQHHLIIQKKLYMYKNDFSIKLIRKAINWTVFNCSAIQEFNQNANRFWWNWFLLVLTSIVICMYLNDANSMVENALFSHWYWIYTTGKTIVSAILAGMFVGQVR